MRTVVLTTGDYWASQGWCLNICVIVPALTSKEMRDSYKHGFV